MIEIRHFSYSRKRMESGDTNISVKFEGFERIYAHKFYFHSEEGIKTSTKKIITLFRLIPEEVCKNKDYEIAL